MPGTNDVTERNDGTVPRNVNGGVTGGAPEKTAAAGAENAENTAQETAAGNSVTTRLEKLRGARIVVTGGGGLVGGRRTPPLGSGPGGVPRHAPRVAHPAARPHSVWPPRA
ncbi:hypothetical protein ACFW15_33695, partial [Streptomyces sp. NPDC058953]